MTYCDCGYEQAKLYKASRPLARKSHRCSECDHTIQPSERYENLWGVWNGHQATYKTCCYCLAIRDLIDARSCCFCWEHENMLEAAIEEIRDNGAQMPGIAMAVGRIMIESRRDQQERTTHETL